MKKSFLTSFRKLGGRGFRVFSAQSGLKIEGVQDIIAVASGKGGVGKSTTADFGNPREMSFFKCPHCGEPWHIFGKGGARRTADEMGLPFLGEIPLEADIRKCSDEGVPVVLSNPDSAVSKAYSDVAQKVVSRLQELSEQQFLLPEINLWSYKLRSQL